MPKVSKRRRSHLDDPTATMCLPQLVKAAVIAAAIDCTEKHIYELAQNGQIPHHRIGTKVRFDPQKIAAWLDTYRIEAA